MRDLILLAVLLGIVPFMLRAPIIGVLAWIWISLLNPQREVYGFLSGAGINFFIAVATLFAWVVSKERKFVPFNATLGLLTAFVIWAGVTTIFALEPVRSGDLMTRTLKTAVLLLAVAAMANTKSRIHAVVWMIAISLGYFAAKGGGFFLLSGGTHKVFGPESSMIEDNNHLGLALVMLAPLLFYLRGNSEVRIVRTGLLMLIGLTFVAIIGTYSRGALLAVAALIAMLAVRSRAGVVVLAFAAIVAVSAPNFMPQAWLERMGTIQTADADASFTGRLEAWRTSFHIATQRITGGGFAAIEHDWVAQAFPTPGGLQVGRAAHSIYFQVLGEHGFIGLALFLGMLASALVTTSRTIHAARGRPDLRWASQLARMLQVSIVAYMVGGAALSMAYYDAFLIVVVLTASLHEVVRRTATAEAKDENLPKWKVVDVEVETPALPPARPELT